MHNFRNCQCFEDCDFSFKRSGFHPPNLKNSLFFLNISFEILFIFTFFVVRIMKSENFHWFFKVNIYCSFDRVSSLLLSLHQYELLQTFLHLALAQRKNSPKILKSSVTDFLLLKLLSSVYTVYENIINL